MPVGGGHGRDAFHQWVRELPPCEVGHSCVMQHLAGQNVSIRIHDIDAVAAEPSVSRPPYAVALLGWVMVVVR